MMDYNSPLYHGALSAHEEALAREKEPEREVLLLYKERDRDRDRDRQRQRQRQRETEHMFYTEYPQYPRARSSSGMSIYTFVLAKQVNWVYPVYSEH